MPLAGFQNTFAGNPLDRAADRRGDAEWIETRLADADSLLLPLFDGKPLVEPASAGGVRLGYAPAGMGTAISRDGERLAFLGLWKNTAVFALDVDDPGEAQAFREYGAFEELRPVLAALPAGEAAIVGAAKALFEWRRSHRFCAGCGQPSRTAEAGWKRICPACAAEHFPRTDPVAIMLAERDGRCLLGRSPRFPPGMFSALAGFVEPGETLEEACARELKEEAGLEATRVRYLFSQPWPFPNSLMIGLIAEVAEGQETAQPDEIEALRWFTREEARRLCADQPVDGVFVPPATAIARQLLRVWAEEAEGQSRSGAPSGK